MSRKAGAEGRVTRRRRGADGEAETTVVGLRAEPAVTRRRRGEPEVTSVQVRAPAETIHDEPTSPGDVVAIESTSVGEVAAIESSHEPVELLADRRDGRVIRRRRRGLGESTATGTPAPSETFVGVRAPVGDAVETQTETALRATEPETETALRATETEIALRESESETEAETETALRATETETALCATETETALRASESESESETEAETETETALRATEAETETETALYATEDTDTVTVTDTDTVSDTVSDAVSDTVTVPDTVPDTDTVKDTVTDTDTDTVSVAAAEVATVADVPVRRYASRFSRPTTFAPPMPVVAPVALELEVTPFEPLSVPHELTAIQTFLAEHPELERFDAPRHRFVVVLLTRAAALPEASQARVVERARERLQALVADHARLRSLAVREARRLGAIGEDPEGMQLAAAKSGDVVPVLHAARRRPERTPRLARRLAEQQSRRLRAVVARRSVLPPSVEAGPVEAPLVIAARLHTERIGDARAQRALDALRARLPEEAGPYHGPTVAARALERLGTLHRPLLRAWLDRLATLSLPSAPVEEEPMPKRKASKKRR